jgi:hypothetical protein
VWQVNKWTNIWTRTIYTTCLCTTVNIYFHIFHLKWKQIQIVWCGTPVCKNRQRFDFRPSVVKSVTILLSHFYFLPVLSIFKKSWINGNEPTESTPNNWNIAEKSVKHHSVIKIRLIGLFVSPKKEEINKTSTYKFNFNFIVKLIHNQNKIISTKLFYL